MGSEQIAVLHELAARALPTLADAAVKGLALLVATAVLLRLMRRALAATRHLVWVLAMGGLIVLPALSAALPGWDVLPEWGGLELTIATPQEPPPVETVAPYPDAPRVEPGPPPVAHVPAGVGGPPDVDGSAAAPTFTAVESAAEPLAGAILRWVPGVWAIGTLLCLLPRLLGRLSLWRLARSAQRVRAGPLAELAERARAGGGLKRRVVLLLSDRRAMPMVWGVFRTRLLLPAEAVDWPANRLQVVLLHELAHARRFDCLAKLIGHVACAVYWFNPLTWLAQRAMQAEAERACDDLVLAAGSRPADYAEHILHIASGLQVGVFAAHAGIAVARPSKLERRIRAILDATRNRRRLTLAAVCLAAAAVLGLVVPLSLMKAGTQTGDAAGAPEDTPAMQPASAQFAGQPSPDRIAELIVQLGDDYYKTREKAQQALVQAGRPAIPQLRIAVRDKDPERAVRAQAAINDIMSRIGYTTRAPAYSLRDEPQRVRPRTLHKAVVKPEEARVFGKPIRWWASHWQPETNTACVAVKQQAEFTRFIVTEPFRRKVHVKYFDVPVSPGRYPILVFTYRARHTDATSPVYVLYLDDGTGPDYGGLLPLVQNDIIPDGKPHTLTYDTRLSKPIGDFIGLSLGVHCDAKGPAEFDLIDLRFESARENPPAVAKDRPLIVKVTGRTGGQQPLYGPIKGAEVIVDAEWSNWARSATTDGDGAATVVPWKTGDGRHMIRVTKPGFLDTEIRDVDVGARQIKVVLEPAVRYGGVVQNQKGQAVAQATVSIRVAIQGRQGQWVRRDANVLTDNQGRWKSPPLPKDPSAVRIGLAHPDYTHGATPCPVKESIDRLQAGQAVLEIKRLVVTVQGRVVDEQGEPIVAAAIRAISGGRPVASDREGRFSITAKAGEDVLLVQHDDFALKVLKNSAQADVAGLAIQLEKGHMVRGKVVDAEGRPLAGVILEARSPLVYRKGMLRLRTDANGNFQWPHAPTKEPMLRAYKHGFVRSLHRLDLKQEFQQIKLTPLRDGPGKQRRPGYDPKKIFRRISDAGTPRSKVSFKVDAASMAASASPLHPRERG